MSEYAWGLLIAISQLFNALLAGRPAETFCSRIADRVPTKHFLAARRNCIKRADEILKNAQPVKE